MALYAQQGITFPATQSVSLGTGATNSRGSFSMTLSAAVAAGSFAQWSYTSDYWSLRGLVTLSFVGTSLANCPDIAVCVSVNGSPGTDCY